jgi:hypothetical protein
MNELQEQLNNCITWFGRNDILTIMTSQRLDKYKVEEQKEEKMNVYNY